MVKKVMEVFGFRYRYRLSTRDPKHPEKYLGHPEIWDKVEKWAVTIMKRNNIEYYDGPGEAAFYAPKMDLMATDALKREWQLSTVQIDYVMPERFDLVYADADGRLARPVMIHRAILGSPERFLMIILEHFAGNLPTWLSPIQVAILPITDRHLPAGQQVMSLLGENGIRCQLDGRTDTLGAKIRDHQIQKVPYMIILGDKEVEAKKITVRRRDGRDLGQMDLNKFLDNIKIEIDKKTLD
jgi:threonyl-tRNA synthetase